ncbi:MAG: hypothetical protein WCP68_24550 [Enhydrobacter sp.]
MTVPGAIVDRQPIVATGKLPAMLVLDQLIIGIQHQIPGGLVE